MRRRVARWRAQRTPIRCGARGGEHRVPSGNAELHSRRLARSPNHAILRRKAGRRAYRGAAGQSQFNSASTKTDEHSGSVHLERGEMRGRLGACGKRSPTERRPSKRPRRSPPGRAFLFTARLCLRLVRRPEEVTGGLCARRTPCGQGQAISASPAGSNQFDRARRSPPQAEQPCDEIKRRWRQRKGVPTGLSNPFRSGAEANVAFSADAAILERADDFGSGGRL